MQPVLVQRPEVGDPRDEDVADGVELDVADLLHLARGADDFERPPLAPVPEVELVVSGNDEELGEKKVNIIKPAKQAWYYRGAFCRKSCICTAMDSHMAGPIYLKLSGIDMGHSVHVFGQKKSPK